MSKLKEGIGTVRTCNKQGRASIIQLESILLSTALSGTLLFLCPIGQRFEYCMTCYNGSLYFNRLLDVGFFSTNEWKLDSRHISQ